MRALITFLFIFSGLISFAQKKTDSAAIKAAAAIPFDYARDFQTILAKTKDATSDVYYHKLLPKFLSLDSTITKAETLALMIGFTQDPRYKPWEDMETEKEIFDLNDSANYQEALDRSKIYLESHPFSLRVLKERSYTYNQLRNRDSAQYFMDMVERVMDAMIYSSKGKTPETPIFSLGLADGEYFIPNVGMTVAHKNTEWNKYNHFVEVIDAMNDMGEHKNYYFVIQHAKEKIDDDMVNDAKEKKPKKSKKPNKESKKKDEKNKKKDEKEKDNITTPTDSIPPGH